MSQQIRTAKLSGTVQWSNGANFNGSARIALVTPSGYPFLSLEGQYPKIRIPEWTTVPIVDGAFDQNVALIFTDDVEPPNSRYTVYFLDLSDTVVGGPTTLTAVSADPFTPTIPTLTVPAAPTVAPDLQD